MRSLASLLLALALVGGLASCHEGESVDVGVPAKDAAAPAVVADATVAHDAAHVFGLNNYAYPVGPAQINEASAGTYPNLTFPVCDAGQVWGTNDGGASMGCVTGGGGGASMIGAKVYVATTGSDSNPCTNVSPCLTYNHAATVATTAYSPTAAANAVVQYGPGTFTDNVSLQPNISLSGDPSYITILSGTMAFGSGFTGSSNITASFAFLNMNGGNTFDSSAFNATQVHLTFFEDALHATAFSGNGNTMGVDILFTTWGATPTFTDSTIVSEFSVYGGLTISATGATSSWTGVGDNVTGTLTINGTAGHGNNVNMESGVAITGDIVLNGANAAFGSGLLGLGSSLTLNSAPAPSYYGNGAAPAGAPLVSLGSNTLAWSSTWLLAAPGAGSNPYGVLAPLPGSTATTAALFLGPGNVASAGTAVLDSNGSSYTELNVPLSTGTVYIEGHTAVGQKWDFNAANAYLGATWNMEFNSLSPDFGGGSGVIGQAKATTNPTTNPTGYVQFADHTNGNPCWRGSAGTVSCFPQ